MKIKIKNIVGIKEVKRCIFCNENSEEGINILNEHICSKCNNRIVNLSIEDVAYNFYKNTIKNKVVDRLEIY